MSNTIVRFVESRSGVLSVLEISSRRARWLFTVMISALFALRVQIVRSEARAGGRRRVDRFYLVEFDGAPIRPNRRLEIQQAVLAAIDGLLERPSYLTRGARKAKPAPLELR